MKTANDYAKFAQEIAQIADRIRPDHPDAQFSVIRNLMVYHLRAASSQARSVAEAIAQQEPFKP